jgi:hypothetical protein
MLTRMLWLKVISIEEVKQLPSGLSEENVKL